MNLAALHMAVRDVVRNGDVADLLAYDTDVVERISVTERAALRAWQRRLRSVGSKIIRLGPPRGSMVWIAARQEPSE